MKRLLARVGIATLALLLLAAAAYVLMNSRRFQLFGELTYRSPYERREVALTFDDGPTPEASDEVLAILREERATATFFLVGREVEAHPDSAAAIVAAGHEVGNHSYSHRRMIFMSPSEVERELVRTELALRAVGAEGDLHFRPPYGKKLVSLPWVLRRKGIRTITWDVEPESTPEIAASTDAIVEHVLQQTTQGSIILLHPMKGQEVTRAAIRPIIRGLRERGFALVPVSTLLEP